MCCSWRKLFTRPKIMNELAKQGFTQSYTYFTWRNSKKELTEYVEELTQSEQKEFYRPNFSAQYARHKSLCFAKRERIHSSPEIFLGGDFEFQHRDLRYRFRVSHFYTNGSRKEEYLNSEKYEYFKWDWEKQNKITTLITRINTITKGTSFVATN